jgi:hypothetical protein
MLLIPSVRGQFENIENALFPKLPPLFGRRRWHWRWPHQNRRGPDQVLWIRTSVTCFVYRVELRAARGDGQKLISRHLLFCALREFHCRSPDRFPIQWALGRERSVLAHPDETIGQPDSSAPKNDAPESERNKLNQTLCKIDISELGGDLFNQLRLCRRRISQKNPYCATGELRRKIDLDQITFLRPLFHPRKFHCAISVMITRGRCLIFQ